MSSVVDSQASEPASQLGLGTAFVLAGQVAFVLSGYALHYVLSRSLDPVAYGTYGLILQVLTWLESALTSGLPWAMRRFIPARPGSALAVLRAGIRWQALAGVGLFAAAALLAPTFARLLRDTAILPFLRLALVDILVMALFTAYQAGLNGLRLFDAQGLATTVYALAKLGGSVVLLRLGFGLAGALAGNVAGTLVGWLAELWFLRRATGLTLGNAFQRNSGLSPDTGRAMLRFALPTVPFTLASYMLTTVGLVGVKAWVQDGVQVAYFSAANYLASAPRLLLVAFWLTLFPHLAGSIAAGDLQSTRSHVRTAVRYLGLLLIPATLLIVGTSSRLIPLLYPAHYAESAPLLNVLLLGTGLHVVYMMFANAIVAEGRTALALAIPCALAPAQLLATWYLANRWGASGAAAASALVSGLAAAVAAGYVVRRFAVRLPWRSLGRISLSALVALALPVLSSAHGLILIAQYLLVSLFYVALLVLLREVTPQEIRRLQAGLISTAQRWKAEAQS